MAKETSAISPGRIVLVVTGVVVKGKETVVVKRPAIVSVVLPPDEKAKTPELVKAHVFVDGVQNGHACCTEWRDSLKYDATGKAVDSWSWGGRIESAE